MHLLADVEANGFLAEATKIWVLCIKDADTKETEVYSDYGGHKPIMFGLKRLKKARKVSFHNALGYDFWLINKLYPGTLRLDQIEDTLILSRMLFTDRGSHKLESWGEFFKCHKGDHKDFSKFSHAMVTYCIQDVEILYKLHKYIVRTKEHYKSLYGVDMSLAEEIEHKTSFVIALQEQHGFRLDVAKAEALTAELRSELFSLEYELQQVFKPWYVSHGEFTPKRDNKTLGYTQGVPFTKVDLEEFNPGSRQQITARLKAAYGWEPTDFTKNGNATLNEEVLSDLPYPEAKLLYRYLRLTKQIGQVADGDNAWLKLVRNTGYVHGSVIPIGCGTHRMSHSKPNIAQADKKDLRMREVWLPDPGEVLVGCDAEGLELRLLAAYLALFDGGAYALSVVEGNKDDGTDAHSRTKNAVNLYSRDKAKTLIYALIYGAFPLKIGQIILDDAKEAGKPPPKGHTSAIGKEAQNKLFAGIPALSKLIKLVNDKHEKRGFVIAADGRVVRTVSKHSSLNYLLQSAGAIVMKYALVIFHFEECPKLGLVDGDYIPTKFNYCANVHDEVQFTTHTDLADLIGSTFAKCITLAGERLGLKCPLAGKYDIGNNWKETH